jgi:hypothetical protein
MGRQKHTKASGSTQPAQSHSLKPTLAQARQDALDTITLADRIEALASDAAQLRDRAVVLRQIAQKAVGELERRGVHDHAA